VTEAAEARFAPAIADAVASGPAWSATRARSSAAELDAWLGFARAALVTAGDRELADMIERIQRDLFALGAQLADPAEHVAGRVAKAALGDDEVARLERLSLRFTAG